MLLIDIGTTSIKLSCPSLLHVTTIPRPLDPSALIMELERAVDALTLQNDSCSCVALSCFGMCLVGVDEHERIVVFETYASGGHDETTSGAVKVGNGEEFKDMNSRMDEHQRVVSVETYALGGGHVDTRTEAVVDGSREKEELKDMNGRMSVHDRVVTSEICTSGGYDETKAKDGNKERLELKGTRPPGGHIQTGSVERDEWRGLTSIHLGDDRQMQLRDEKGERNESISDGVNDDKLKFGIGIYSVRTEAKKAEPRGIMLTRLPIGVTDQDPHRPITTKLHIEGCPDPHLPCFALMHIKRLHTRVVRFTTLTSFLLERWTGRRLVEISPSEASWWGMLDWKACEWDSNALAYLGPIVRSKLPRIALTKILPFSLSNEYVRRWPSLCKAKLFYGIVDGASATLGACPMGNMCVTIATSAAVRVMLHDRDVRSVPTGCFLYRLDRERVVMGGSLTDGGLALDVAVSLTGLNVKTLPAEELLGRLPGQIICLPFFSPSGERAPGWAGSSVPSAFVGLKHDNQPGDLLIASVSGVVCRLSRIAALIKTSCVNTMGVYTSGGALSNSALWRRALAGALNADLYYMARAKITASEDEATLRGLYFFASDTMFDNINWISRVVEPRPDSATIERFVRYARKQDVVYKRLLRSLL